MACQSKMFLFIELPKWSHMSHNVKINVSMICIFIIFKLVYFTTVNLDLHFKYKHI
jgi:formate hydrogenlyase subunit 3/multisubunit Na+/H+ antiporter MnhD subunit